MFKKVLSEKGENQAASEVLERITILDPDNKTVHSELRKERMKARENTKQQKSLYQKMMGGAAASKQKKADRSKVRLSIFFDSSVWLNRSFTFVNSLFQTSPLHGYGLQFASVLPWGMVVGSMAAVVVGMVAYRLKFI